MIFLQKNNSLLYLIGITIFFAIFFFGSCEKEVLTPDDIDFDKIPYKTLSEYGFFEGNPVDMKPSERVLPYEPVSQLFSDYAEKSRFVWMPQGVSASISEEENLQIHFPDKSILIKNFYYPQAENGKQRIIETRLLMKKQGKWHAYAYIWNDAQSEATYKITGANIPVSFTHEGKQQEITYIQPNKNQCKSCHNQNEELMPIGPKARNLNYDFDYGRGEVKNQLAKWQQTGYLTNFTHSKSYPCMADYTDESADLELRAKAYLDINCGHCHSAVSPASTSGLFLTYEEEDMTKWGVYKPPVAAGIGAGSYKYDIYPGKGDESIFVHRMKSTHPAVMMPEIGRVSVHQEGVALIREWIDGMTDLGDF